jgi:DNA invertase Pin-like site-specific DNA recombinase
VTDTQTQKPLIRAGCYCRISSDPKDKREGTQRQREDTAILCETKDWQVAGYYVDDDRSASNGKHRPEWERLLADIEAGKIDAVAAWDQDRVNRMMEDFIRYKKLFVKRGIKLATSNNGDIDLSTPSGVLTATIKTAVSEHEIAMMKIRMRRAARQKAEQGIPKWTRAFGYLDDTRQPDPHVAPLVQQAYAAIIAGSSLADICRLWNNADALTQRWYKRTDPDTGEVTLEVERRLWTQPQVSNFLRKARNAGLRSHTFECAGCDDHGAGHEVTEIVGKGTWPALVEESTWRAAQSVLNAPGRAPGRKSVRRHLLTGVLGCGKCGHHLSGNHTLDKSITYSCKQCRGVSIRAEHVEPLIIGVIGGRLAKPDAVDLLRAELHDEAEAEKLRVEVNTLNAELDNIGVERADGLLTGRQAKIATDRINEKLAAIEHRQHDQEKLRVFDGIPLGTPDAVAAVERLSPDRLRAVLAVLANVVVLPVGSGNGRVFNPERVQVNWR